MSEPGAVHPSSPTDELNQQELSHFRTTPGEGHLRPNTVIRAKHIGVVIVVLQAQTHGTGIIHIIGHTRTHPPAIIQPRLTLSTHILTAQTHLKAIIKSIQQAAVKTGIHQTCTAHSIIVVIMIIVVVIMIIIVVIIVVIIIVVPAMTVSVTVSVTATSV